MRGRRGQPATPGAPVVTLRRGRVVRHQRRAATAPQDRTIPPSLLGRCHVIQRERPQPFPGMSTPAPAGLRAAAGRSRPSTGRCDDGLRRHPQDPDGPLQGLVAAGRRQPGQPDLRHPRPSPRLQARPARRLARDSWVDPRLGKQAVRRPGRGSGGRSGRPTPTAARPPSKRPRHASAATCCPSSSSASSARSPSAWCAAGRTSCAATVADDTVMAARSMLYRILQAAEDDRRIDANPVRKVPAPKPPGRPRRAARPRQAPGAHSPRSSGGSSPAPGPPTATTCIACSGPACAPGSLAGCAAARPARPAPPGAGGPRGPL